MTRLGYNYLKNQTRDKTPCVCGDLRDSLNTQVQKEQDIPAKRVAKPSTLFFLYAAILAEL